MIKNERQLRITKTQLDNFRHHLALIEKEKEKGKVSSLIDAEAEAVRNQIKELEDQAHEYEILWSSDTPIPILHSFEDIPQALIKARISLGLSQKKLAERIGLKEQQIQRYEATNYETASLSRISNLVEIFNLELSDNIRLETRDFSVTDFVKNLTRAGLERRFIINRLLPPRILTILQNAKDTTLNNFGIQVVDHIGNIFGWNAREIIEQKTLALNISSLGNVRYKLPKRVSVSRFNTYTFYTHYLASIILHSTWHLPKKELPTDPIRIHKIILDTYGSFSFENALRYIWDLGVPVISIGDPGAFHGAYFRESERNIIIIKHRTKSYATWLFSLFHEFWHAAMHQSDVGEKILMLEDFENLTSTGVEDIEEEGLANLFAGAVLLGRPTDPLVHMCMKEADYNLRKLKQIVQKVAIRETVPVDVLANCVAFRVSQEGKNWWGAAKNLQETRYDIQRISRDILLDYVDLSQISGLDLDLLRRSFMSCNSK